MLKRFILVSWILALLFLAAAYYAENLLNVVNILWSLDDEGRKKLLDVLEFITKIVGIIAVILTSMGFVIKFIQGRNALAENGSGTRFEAPTNIHGDFVQGNKTEITVEQKDA